jgi:hypothetical protein
MLLGRIDSADVFADHHAELPSAYVFRVTSGGQWTLLSTKYKEPARTLAQGTFAGTANGWMRLSMAFHGDRISVSLDGKELASVRDKAHTHGMFGLGTGWNRAQFDNVSVMKTAAKIQ